MNKFKVNTEDTILFINRVFIIDAESKEHAQAIVKDKYPNSTVKSVTEYDERD